MDALRLTQPATRENFNESGYLAANPDVRKAVDDGYYVSGHDHFLRHGVREARNQRLPSQLLDSAKARKLERIAPLLRSDLPMVRQPDHYDFLSDTLRRECNISDTDSVSSNEYDGKVMALLERHANGLVLDCGAGRRGTYFDHVVNFEIVDYDTTDVRGVGECLPFVDGAFDAVISIAVLEHVRDPFRCAAELVRVLKPGGELICCVPFLQPYHGYPHHYYNMTHQGLRALFERDLTVDSVEVIDSTGPVWALTWILQSWAQGLEGKARKHFLNQRVSDLLLPPNQLLQSDFVRELDDAKKLELASACLLSARKPA
ncbi:class I SAM-dependent methyltransferase [Tahibacter amnicola]|uniref:Methyltransferase domain-containing protein n=1 Tax=Tahibacter amnicola TaxID=2976241 RepID=A0ABY6BH80_9GAMM|nr:methyltransferase domain-containing protein [Tahibacter amnicola]UXI69224.1 methyltransferase domain-containing protein [Tahibacter amnicola]